MPNNVFQYFDGTQPPKRKRIVTSCHQCRKKKVKCDKARPACGNCLKAKINDQCLYQEPSWNSETILRPDYASAASMPMAHISLTSIPKQPPKKVISTPQIIRNKPQRIDWKSPKIIDQTKITDISDNKIGISTPPQQTQSSTNVTSNVPQNFTFGPNQPSIMCASTNFKENSAQSSEKIKYHESNLRQSLSSDVQETAVNPTGASNQLTEEIHRTKYINFHDFDEPVHVRAGRLIAAGPLSLKALVRRDPYLKVILIKLRKEKQIRPVPWKNQNQKTSELVNEIILEQKYVNNARSRQIDEKFKATLIQNEGIDEVKTKKDTSKRIRMDYETETILKIEEVLPESKLLWILVDRFFSGALAAFLPFISEAIFNEKIQKIIGCKKDENKKIINMRVTRKFDFAYLGELLLILRLTYLSVSKTAVNSPQERYILSNPIGLNVVHAAEMCLNQFKLLRRGALPIIQFSLFMRFYHKFAPEDGDGADGGDSQVFLGMLLQMGTSIGLNRDLSNSDSLKTNTTIVNTWRILWHEIVTLDLHQSLHMGNPILVNENYYDTLLPTVGMKTVGLNLSSFDLQQAVVNIFETNDELNKYIREILKDILNLNRMVKVDELLVKVGKLESFIDKNFISLENIYAMNNFSIKDRVSKVYKFINYIDLKTALFVIHYNIYLNNPKENFHTLMKILTFAMELAPLSFLMITTNNEKTNYFDLVFGTESQLLILPSITLSLQKVHNIMVGLVSRCLDLKFNYPPNENSAKFESIRVELCKTLDVILNGYQTLSSDYYQSWRFCKGSVYVVELLMDLENNLFDKKSEMNLQFEKEVVHEVFNHFKAIPNDNELRYLTSAEVQEIDDLVHSEYFKNSLLQWLNGRNSKSKSQSDKKNTDTQSHLFAQPSTPNISIPITPSSTASTFGSTKISQGANGTSTGGRSSSSSLSTHHDNTTHKTSSGLYVNKNAMSKSEIDRIWIQMIASNVPGVVDDGFNSKNNNDLNSLNKGSSNENQHLNSNLNANSLNNSHDDSNGTNSGIRNQTNGIEIDQDNVHNLQPSINSFMEFAPFESFNLDHIIDFEAPYDVFGDTSFFNEN